MTKPFAKFSSDGGYIGRLAWWNTFDTGTMCAVNVQIWGKGSFLLKSWGSAK